MVNRGWILRNTLIWYKPGCMPSSAKDRFTVDFEYLFFFSKKKNYYFETQYEPHLTQENRPDGIVREREFGYNTQYPEVRGFKTKPNIKQPQPPKKHGQDINYSPQGRNKRTVWSINPQPFGEGVCMNCGHFAKPKGKQEKKGYFGGEDKSKSVCEWCGQELITSHFAIYPEELCETPIKAGCPKFVCKKCGNPKELIVENITDASERRKRAKIKLDEDIKNNKVKLIAPQERPHNPVSPYEDLLREYCQREGMNIGKKEFKGYKPTCNCNVEFTSGIVLDPFFGAGTTGLVALKQNKKFVGIELNKEYVKIAEARIKPYLQQTKLEA